MARMGGLYPCYWCIRGQSLNLSEPWLMSVQLVRISGEGLRFETDRRRLRAQEPFNSNRNICRVPSGAMPGTTIASLVRFHAGAGSSRSGPPRHVERNIGGDFTVRRVFMSRNV